MACCLLKLVVATFLYYRGQSSIQRAQVLRLGASQQLGAVRAGLGWGFFFWGLVCGWT